MELLQSLSKLTPEERKAEVRRQMRVELKAVEMEHIPTAALETLANRKTAEVRETLQSMQKDRLSVGHWVEKYQQNHEKKREKRRLKAEAQRAKYIASRSHGPQPSLLNFRL
ncbi:hypothetical protein JOQ06_009011, partial [Pogonophryne albipinna]